MRYSLSTLLVLSGLLATVAGCKPEDEIAHYRAPKSNPPIAASMPSPVKSEGMLGAAMLGAIVPHDTQAWFFKLTGPAAALHGRGEAFRKFVLSVHFEGDQLRYDPPIDWQAQGPSGLRHETFLIPSADKPLELAISTLAKPAGDDEAYLLSNINRWRGQMGLEPITGSQIAKNTNRVKLADGTTATLVAIAGSAEPGGTAAAQPAGATATPPRDAEPAGSAADGMLAAIVPQNDRAWFFKLGGPAAALAEQREAFRKFIESVHFEGDEPRYAPPADWRAQGGAGMRHETFRIAAAGQTLELAVSTLVKPPGDAQAYLLANVNRWRGQLGLAPIDAAQLAGETSTARLSGGQSATLVDLVGKLQTGGNAPPVAPGK